MEVVTLGSFILDDIYQYPPVLQPSYAIAGGAGLYAAIAARMFYPGSRSTRVGLIVHKGRDFPKLVKKQIEDLNMHAKFIDRSDSNTTRGSNVYDVDGNRKFAFVTPNIKIHASMMDEVMLTSNTYHIICTPSRCVDLCLEISEARRKLQGENLGVGAQFSRHPLFIWEPMEDCCRSSERAAFLKAFEFVDVFSPNLRELLTLMDIEATAGPDFDAQMVYNACRDLLGGNNRCTIVVRCGPHGCVVIRPESQYYLAVPAYHKSINDSGILKPSNMIVDPTGGGNAFLGGFCAALSSDLTVDNFSTYEAASFYGSVAASYAIEQRGVPQMSTFEGREMWNSSSPSLRLRELVHRLQEKLNPFHGLRTVA